MANKDNRWTEIPEKRRELYFTVFNGFSINSTTGDLIFYRLGFLNEHFPDDKIDKALRWLIDNHLTGPKFCDWFQGPCKGSDLQMHANLLTIVNNELALRIVARQNFRI